MQEVLRRVRDYCPEFMEVVLPLSYPKEYPPAPHLSIWAAELQNNRYTVKLSGRKHLKSTSMYGYLMWKIWRGRWMPKDWEVLYISYTKTLAAYHLKNVKKNIRNNQFFKGIIDMAPNSESKIQYSWDNKHVFIIEPEGILSFKRGRHPDEVVTDDILADPASELDPTVIEKINRVFKEDVMSLPKEKTGELHMVGTAQHLHDIFFQLKGNEEFHWTMNKSIINDVNQETLWPELFNYRRLMQIRNSIGDKAFKKEFLCSPVWSEEAYLKMGQLIKVAIAPHVKLGNIRKRENMIVSGYDVGKHTHPAHFAVFEISSKGRMDMIYERYFDHCNYNHMVEEINDAIKIIGIDYNYYDATRGELEALQEQGIMDSSVWIPVIFKTQIKHKMAAEFEKRVTRQIEGKEGGITLINNQRMLEQISMVNNDLKAVTTAAGHGDSFWSCAMACLAALRIQEVDYDDLTEAMDKLSGGEDENKDEFPDLGF